MPAVPQTKASWTNGVDPLNSTNLHAYLRDPINFLMTKPVAELRQNTGQSIPSGTYTAITFNLETVDNDPDGIGGHSTVSNTSRYTARYPGWYRVGASVTFSGNSANRRSLRWMVNGAQTGGGAILIGPGTSAPMGPVAADPLIYLDIGDYLEVHAFQDSGVALTLLTGTENQPRMTVQWERI